jgi:hypothetical protein
MYKLRVGTSKIMSKGRLIRGKISRKMVICGFRKSSAYPLTMLLRGLPPLLASATPLARRADNTIRKSVEMYKRQRATKSANILD